MESITRMAAVYRITVVKQHLVVLYSYSNEGYLSQMCGLDTKFPAIYFELYSTRLSVMEPADCR